MDRRRIRGLNSIWSLIALQYASSTSTVLPNVCIFYTGIGSETFDSYMTIEQFKYVLSLLLADGTFFPAYVTLDARTLQEWANEVGATLCRRSPRLTT
jgi:hypothetical protein